MNQQQPYTLHVVEPESRLFLPSAFSKVTVQCGVARYVPFYMCIAIFTSTSCWYFTVTFGSLVRDNSLSFKSRKLLAALVCLLHMVQIQPLLRHESLLNSLWKNLMTVEDCFDWTLH